MQIHRRTRLPHIRERGGPPHRLFPVSPSAHSHSQSLDSSGLAPRDGGQPSVSKIASQCEIGTICGREGRVGGRDRKRMMLDPGRLDGCQSGRDIHWEKNRARENRREEMTMEGRIDWKRLDFTGYLISLPNLRRENIRGSE